jgi:hypothetical protein
VTFTELYATLCEKLFSKMPTFDDPDSTEVPPKKITFRRVLLNKCQEEFELGNEAMAAVEAREKKEREAKESGEAVEVRAASPATCTLSTTLLVAAAFWASLGLSLAGWLHCCRPTSRS